ncbi:hypothetical protein LRR18_16815, partial [Mangrovimonas sp. AS39]|uniref:hypothetical protein n=1 Tax=Mangrovimonas futianensis TaxID=2895523 RepID=UPI001E62BF71
EGSKYNGLYKILSISVDSTNLLEAITAKPTEQQIQDTEYTFYREHLIEAFTIIEEVEEEKTPSQPFLAWNWFNLP